MACSLRITRYVAVLMMFLGSLSWTNAVAINCGVCEKSRCPELHYCEGEVVKDNCGCCNVCSDDKHQPHPLLSDNGESRDGGACQQVDCPKFKVCVENIQGLPLCTCPGSFICKRRARPRRTVCGSDGVTYESRCYLRIAACNSAARIKVAHKGPCGDKHEADAIPKHRTCPSSSTCRKRKRPRPICGTDGMSYRSRCHMKVAACQKGVKIRMKNHGACKTSSSVSSPSSGRTVTRRPATPVAIVPEKVDVAKDRRRRKKKVGSDVARSGVVKKNRRKQRRDKRKKQKKQRRRRRRKTRGHSRIQRDDIDRQQLRKIQDR